MSQITAPVVEQRGDEERIALGAVSRIVSASRVSDEKARCGLRVFTTHDASSEVTKPRCEVLRRPDGAVMSASP